ncbi:hypothetical protein CYMTET_47746 [Cymbomonas tetramitiformis]|uniref:Uncharacterized protein n=1 Tax=Cymbomonas tetramitiformis TaxID=36881 RepID=A0AAE0EWF4_9CHLO|nr:hypothetical protein CYMTET_47746 [Cymbomonas tetramitiformis]
MEMTEILARSTKTESALAQLHEVRTCANLARIAPRAVPIVDARIERAVNNDDREAPQVMKRARMENASHPVPVMPDEEASPPSPSIATRTAEATAEDALTLSGISESVRREIETPLFRNRRRLLAIEKQRAETSPPSFRIGVFDRQTSADACCSYCDRKISTTRTFVIVRKNANNEQTRAHFNCVLKYNPELLATTSADNIDHMTLTRKQIDYIRKKLKYVSASASSDDARF